MQEGTKIRKFLGFAAAENVTNDNSTIQEMILINPIETTSDNIYNAFMDITKSNSNNFTKTSDELTAIAVPSIDEGKYVAETETGMCFEMADGLKNYATVNTAEPITTQLSYNIGTENIENGKDGETLNNTEMNLEESSVITEIENTGLDLYDMKLAGNNFDPNMFNDNSNYNGNVKIIDVQMIKSKMYMPEALQMSLACEEEAPSTWEDAINLLNTQNVNEQPTINETPIISKTPIINETPLTALPTTIQTYLDVAPQSNFMAQEKEQNYLYIDVNQLPGNYQSINNNTNILKNLTADAEICGCENCQCDPYNPCHGCSQNKDNTTNNAKDSSSQTELSINSTNNNGNTSCNCGNNSGCCGTKTNDTISENVAQNCDKIGDNCCVVVCLKSLDQLRNMIAAASSCGNFQNLSMGCVKGMCTVKK